jgi:ADP-heptose:LPS heptosyltransferase
VYIHGVLDGLLPAAGPAPPPSLAPSDTERRRAAAAVRRWGWEGNPIVGLHPGTRPEKRWAIERFEDAARRIEAAGARVLVFSGPGERSMLEFMGPPGPTRIYAPPTDVRGLMALLGVCSVFLSGDCGPMHLAAALGVHCVAVFRIDNHDRYGPPGEGHRVLYDANGRVEAAAAAGQVLELLELT